jgi:cytochrome P450
VTALLGLNPEDHEYLSTMVSEVIHALPGVEPGRSIGIKAHADFERYVDQLVMERIAAPGDDLISAIGAASTADADRLTSAEIASFISLLLVAGGETTDRAIANFWYLLLTQRDVLDAIRRDETLIEAAITEFMRYDGVVVYEDRRTTRAVEIRGVEIPEDSLVRVGLMSANNDETVFADPRRFELLRPDLRQGKENRAGAGRDGVAAHVGFGIGKHFCIGYQLARAEMTVATQRALELLESAHISVSEPPTMKVDWFHRYLDRLIVDVD